MNVKSSKRDGSTDDEKHRARPPLTPPPPPPPPPHRLHPRRRNCVALLKGMLRADPDHRLTADEVVEHPWFRDDDESGGGGGREGAAPRRDVTGGLRKLGAKKRLQRAVRTPFRAPFTAAQCTHHRPIRCLPRCTPFRAPSTAAQCTHHRPIRCLPRCTTFRTFHSRTVTLTFEIVQHSTSNYTCIQTKSCAGSPRETTSRSRFAGGAAIIVSDSQARCS